MLLTTMAQRLGESHASRRIHTSQPAKKNAALILQIFRPKHRHLCKHKHQRRKVNLTAASFVRSRRRKPQTREPGDLRKRNSYATMHHIPGLSSLSRLSERGHSRYSCEAMRDFADGRRDL